MNQRQGATISAAAPPHPQALVPNELRVDRETLEKEFLGLARAEGVSDIEGLNKILDLSQGRSHGFTFKPSLAAALRWRSSKLKNTFVSKTSAAATCSRSKLRVPRVGV